MSGSYLVPDCYVHPDYLLVDQVLDQIGRNIINDWDSGCIEASKILHQVKVADEQGFTRRVNGVEVAYLTPPQEAAMHKVLTNSKRPGKKQKDQLPPEPLPFNEFLRKGYIGQFYSKYGFLKNLSSKSISNTQGRISCNAAFLLCGFANQASSSEIILGSIDFSEHDLVHKEERIDLNNLLNLTKVRNTLRDALVEDKLRSYAGQGGQYTSIPPNVWGTEKGWWRLLIEGFMIKIVWIESHPIDPLEKKIVSEGRVFFKKAEVNTFLQKSLQALPCIDSQQSREFWEKLFDPKKPWLKLMNEMALELSNEEIKTKLKKQLEDDIEKKARSSGLVPSDNKVALIATFLRAPEQEKGTTYRSRKKKEKPKPEKQKQKSKKK